MEVKPGYKQTEVGVIPEEWQFDRLEKFVRRHNSGIYKKSALYGKGCNIVGVSDLYGIDCVDGQRFSEVPLTTAEQAKHTLVSNDLLYGESSLVREGIARTVYVTDRGAGTAFAWHTRRYSVDQSSLFPPYLYFYLQGRRARQHMMDQSIQTAITGINTVAYFACPVLRPPLPEQRAIAEALRDVDWLLGGLNRLIAKKRDLKQAAMQQLLTGQTRLPGFLGEWEVKAIHELARVGRGRVISHVEISKSSSPTYPVFSSQTSNSGIMGYLDTYDFEGDYVTWTTDGANAGTVFARSGRFNCTNVCGTIKLHDSDHRFIAAALGRVSQAHVSRHLGNPKLMNDVMKKIEITIPKARAEQTAIAELLTAMDAELAALEQRREKTRALKQAMMQELLTGKTRLV